MHPQGKSLVIAGRNAQGKSSVLDSIVYALGGKGEVCERPIRDGESRAEITVDLDEFVVTRTFTAAGGGMLKVVPKGEKHSLAQPQSVLDKLIGSLTFDPLAFSRMKESNQADCLRRLVGLDFTELDDRYKKTYDSRLEIGREVTILQGKLAGWTDTKVQQQEVSVATVLSDKAAAEAHNRQNQLQRQNLDKIVEKGRICESKIAGQKAEIERLKAQLAGEEAALEKFRADHESLSKQFLDQKSVVDGLKDVDTSAFDKQILEASETNEKIRRNNENLALSKQWAEKSSNYDAFTKKLAGIEEEKTHRIAAAKFPLPGLSFSADGTVTYNSVPFSQVSAAEKLKISAAISIALNPKLRVMLIRDGSLLDGDSLEVLKGLAEEHDAQLWVEKVGGLGDELPGVIIEDGEIVEKTI